MRLLSLFSGAGLGDLGWMMAGFDIVAQCEIDEYCQKVLALRFPESIKYKDIKELTGEQIKKDVGTVDIVAGGFPCQDISIAGRGEGINGTRSRLWFEQLRIIRLLRPRYAVVENVAGLLVRGLGMVLGGLAEVGYNAEWQVLSSKKFGAYHLRKRLWIVAYPSECGLEKWGEIFRDSRHQTSTTHSMYNFEESLQSDGRIWPCASGVQRVGTKIANRIHRFKSIGNGQDPHITAFIGQRIMEFERMNKT